MSTLLSECWNIFITLLFSAAVGYRIYSVRKRESLFATFKDPKCIEAYYQAKSKSTDMTIDCNHDAVVQLVKQLEKWKKLDLTANFPVKIDYAPDTKEDYQQTMIAFNQLFNLCPGNPAVVAVLAKAATVMGSAQLRSFTGGKGMYISYLLIFFFLIYEQAISAPTLWGIIYKCSVSYIFVFPIVFFFFIPWRNNFLLYIKARKYNNYETSDGARERNFIFRIIDLFDAPATTTRYYDIAGREVKKETDDSMGLTVAIAKLTYLIMSGMLMPLTMAVQFIINFIWPSLKRPDLKFKASR